MTNREHPRWNLAAEEADALLRLVATGDPKVAGLLVGDLLHRSQSLESPERHKLVSALGVAYLAQSYDVDMPAEAFRAGIGGVMHECDYLVVGVKEPELQALKFAFGISPDEQPAFRHHGAKYWSAELATSGIPGVSNRSVLITKSGEDGNTRFSAFLSGAFQAIRPRMAVLVGMGGGQSVLDWKTVVMSHAVWQTDYGTRTPEGFSPELRPFGGDAWLQRALSFFQPSAEEWEHRLATASQTAGIDDLPTSLMTQGPDRLAKTLRLRRGILAAADTKFEGGPDALDAQLSATHKDALIVEMEGVGLAEACDEVRIPWIAFRGVSDSGETDRTKSFQFLATLNAAVVARLLIETEFMFDDEVLRDAQGF